MQSNLHRAQLPTLALIAFTAAATTHAPALQLAPDLEDLARASVAARERGDLTAAESALVELVAQAPDFLPAQLSLGLVRYESNAYPGAVAPFQAALAIDTSVAGVRGLLGHALLESGHVVEADRVLREALSRGEGDAQARFWLARALIEQQQFPEARELVAGLERSTGDDPELLRLRILAFSPASGPFRERIMRIAPESVAARITAAEALTAAREWDDARAAYEGIIQSHPHRRGIRIALGDLLVAQGEHGAAAGLFSEESELAPYAPRPLIRLGDALLLQGDSAAAEGALRRALEIDQGSSEALELLAKARSDQGDHRGALAYLLEAVESGEGKPDSGRLHYQLSRVYRHLGDNALADTHMDEYQRLQGSAASR